MAAIFEVDGERFIPTERARGPWDPNALHGGAPAALLARCLEADHPAPGLTAARLTVELLRPVPLAPLLVRTEVVRPGRKVQWLQGSVVAGEIEVARATLLRLRRERVEVPEAASATDPSPPMAEPGERPRRDDGPIFSENFEFGFVTDTWEVRGPKAVWFRLLSQVVPGEEPSPLVRVAACADFGNGISAPLSWETHTFINADLTIYLYRELDGDWVCLDAVTHMGPDGTGLSDTALHDRRGRFGRTNQALLISSR